jgi:hypothetical protein
MLVVGLLMHYWQDRVLTSNVSLPGWYLPLRLRLSAVASCALVIAALLS